MEYAYPLMPFRECSFLSMAEEERSVIYHNDYCNS